MKFEITKNESKSSGEILTGDKGPEIGDTKKIVKFAWFPVKINTRYIIWLERYIEVHEWRYRYANKNSYFGVDMDEFLKINKVLGWGIKERKFYK